MSFEQILVVLSSRNTCRKCDKITWNRTCSIHQKASNSFRDGVQQAQLSIQHFVFHSPICRYYHKLMVYGVVLLWESNSSAKQEHHYGIWLIKYLSKSLIEANK